MHFIQIKAGKLDYQLPDSILRQTLRFADNYTQFENVQCNQMMAVSNDTVCNGRLIDSTGDATKSTGSESDIDVSVSTNQYVLDAHFHLVTSNYVSKSTKKLLDKCGIELILGRGSSYWGPRVWQYCSRAKTPFSPFE